MAALINHLDSESCKLLRFQQVQRGISNIVDPSRMISISKNHLAICLEQETSTLHLEHLQSEAGRFVVGKKSQTYKCLVHIYYLPRQASPTFLTSFPAGEEARDRHCNDTGHYAPNWECEICFSGFDCYESCKYHEVNECLYCSECQEEFFCEEDMEEVLFLFTKAKGSYAHSAGQVIELPVASLIISSVVVALVHPWT
ncbi:hypothetical protein HYE67_003248 [Fusarium culmorum]|uniref:Uncharacterized protein n=1 Tax=Fusarium culmorum TaxID=5516 RepID=A0A2T4GQ55_FUSCU|nr:hypothetical protein FCULG_00000375 [Fusarium culmorum]QPC61017.1 hypothetical protein HYE67_003248 [Fusarium culmorum]